jgi:DNA mismatch endonuclease (patch repair protein)
MDRSENMSRIRGRDTLPEVKLRHAVWQLGMRYRLNQRISGTRPDFIFPRHRLGSLRVVFVDGYFWHGCPEHYVRPRSSNAAFWASKLGQNVALDERQLARLHDEGWRVMRVWEHDVAQELSEIALCIQHVALGERAIPEERWVVTVVIPGESAGREYWTLRELWTGRVRQVKRFRRTGSRRKAGQLAN